MQAVPPSCPDPDALTASLAGMIRGGRLGAARPVLAALRRLRSPSPRIAELAAVLAIKEGRLADARAELDAAVVAAPEHAALRRCRADVRHRQGDLAGAALDAAEAVVLEPHDPAGKAILGVVMLELDRADDAVACLGEAVAARPADPAFCEGLAMAQAARGEIGVAAATLAAGIAAAPGHVSLRNAAVLMAIRQGDFAAAVEIAEVARHDGVADACLFGLKGHALSSLGRHEEAGAAYHEALKLGPDDPYVRHLVAASGAVPEARRAPPEYLRAVFDGYADRFESHLIALGYRVPGLFRAAVLRHASLPGEGRLGPVLDLGCGTGLIGIALSDLPVGPVVGVDLSARMLEQAAGKELYETLHEADALAVLATHERRWELVLAGDTLCYFGALDEIMQAVYAALRPGGLFICSVEALVPDPAGAVPVGADWVLGRTGRYAHAHAYVERTGRAAGFSLREVGREALRLEGLTPVPGLIVVLERTKHDG